MITNLASQPIIFLFSLIVLVVIAVLIGKTKQKTNPSKYSYTKKDFFMSRAEHECYNALIQAVGHDYYIFAQVHLSTIVNHTIKGQSWQGALSHINRKSVDFVLCDKSYISPKLAIELDDKSHQEEERKTRDQELERILAEAGVPLLRLENHGSFDSTAIQKQIQETLTTHHS